jgi:CheY-like chemotaxis protein
MLRPDADHRDALRGVYVLVIDSDGESRGLVVAVLRYCAAYVHAVSSFAEGMTAMTHLVPDVLLVDTAADEDAGFAFMREVRALKALEGGAVPAIGLGSRERAREARHCGFDAYLAKPFDAWQLCGTIVRLVAR